MAVEGGGVSCVTWWDGGSGEVDCVGVLYELEGNERLVHWSFSGGRYREMVGGSSRLSVGGDVGLVSWVGVLCLGCWMVVLCVTMGRS